MPTLTQKAIRIAYGGSQFTTVFFQFAGSISALYKYEAAYNHTHIRKPEEYILIAAVSAVAAAFFTFTANKFQGVKIIEDLPKEGAHETFTRRTGFAYKNAPRNWKSNLAEAVYLASAALLITINNYFIIAGLKAYINALSNPNKVQSILPLGVIGLILMAIKTIFCDLPFIFTSAAYGASEEIKNDITESKEGPFVSLLVKPLLANKFGILWTTVVGTASHSLWDLTGLLLCIPPEVFIAGFKHPTIFWPVLAASAIPLMLLTIINLTQTRYFEAKESEINLKSLMPDPYVPLRPKPKEGKDFLYKVLEYLPWLKQPFLYGLYSHGFVHACGDAMPALLSLRNTIPGSVAKQLLIATLVALLIWLGSAIGTHCSEVKYSRHHFKNEFRFIGEKKTVPVGPESKNSGMTCCLQ